MADVSAPAFWTDPHARGGDGWELRQPAAPLVEHLERTLPQPGRVAVPGCGRGHDVRCLARHGLEAVGFDFSPRAVAEARRLAKADRVVPLRHRPLFARKFPVERARGAALGAAPSGSGADGPA